MRLGLHVGYWGLGLTADEQLKLVREAESVGFDSVWAAEAYGSDTATVLAWLAANTEKIKIGSAIFQMPGRSPAMTAMTAATLDNLSNGRVILGIGTSGPQVAEGWHGQRFAKQLQRTREYVAILRKALARERLALYAGGMGSREKNFYNALVRRYGFEEAAEEVQDLYLSGKKDEAAAALPAELIDKTALVGPVDRVKERLELYREAGVGTLITTPIAPDMEGRAKMMRALGDLL